MDTSKIYIKMNLKAPELWKEWKPIEGDFIYLLQGKASQPAIIKEWSGKNASIKPLLNNGGKWAWWIKEEMIPLFRQDQLQDMVGVFNSEVIAYFLSALKRFEVKTNRQFKSWEQLWLAFVMKEKFGKVWNGIEWTGIK